MSSHDPVESAVAEAHRREWAFVLASTVRVARDLDLAEDCVQEAYAAALESWRREGVPSSPAAWLTTTARRRAVDAIRRDSTLRSKLPLLVEPEEEASPAESGTGRAYPSAEAPAVRDERLRLVFLCCHPALSQDAQVALTLRLVCGVSTPDIARLFLVSESTMAARLTRAKRKIAVSRIPLRMPSRAELPERRQAVLNTVHLLFTTGHTAPSGAQLVRHDLVQQALDLCRMLRALMPDDPGVAGLLALVLVTDARRATRTTPTGEPLPLRHQDRSRWDQVALAEGHDLVVEALSSPAPGRYAIQAAIASLHAEAPTYDATDWEQILSLYDVLLREWPSPVVALNRIVPLSHVVGAAAALEELAMLEDAGHLSHYPYLFAVKAELLTSLGRSAEAAEALRQALRRTENAAERRLLEGRLRTVGPAGRT